MLHVQTPWAPATARRTGGRSEARQLRAALADIIDALPSIIAVVDRQGRVEFWNEKARDFCGMDAAEASGRPLTDLLPQFSRPLGQLADIIERRTPLTYDRIQLFCETGRRFFTMQIVPLSAGGEGRAVVRIDETTERVRIEELMVQTEKMVMVGSLAAGMAHELNNPLGAIMQHAQNIERRVSADIPANHRAARELGIELDAVRAYLEQRGILEFIGHIREGGARTARIIEGMLKFSRTRTSGIEPVALPTLIDQTLELAANDYDLKKCCGFRQVRIERHYQPDMPRVPANAAEIEQVLFNVIKNAAQAMASAAYDAPPALTIRLYRDGGHAVIEIEDNGPGMSDAVRRRIFEPFFTTREVGIGTGLGLSVAYSIVTGNHHGSIEARSCEGLGACFTIRLPIKGRES